MTTVLRWIWRRVRGLSMLGAWALLAVSLVHACTGDGVRWLVFLHALATWWPLCAGGFLAVAVFGWWLDRDRAMALMAIPSLVVLLGWAVANRPPGPTAPLPEGPRLTVVSANHLMINPTPDAFFAELLAETPDVLLVQEHTPRSEAVLAGRFPHVLSTPETHSFGQGVYSRYPFLWARTDQLVGVDWQRVAIEVEGQVVELWNVHTLPPFRADYHPIWQEQVAELVRAAEQVETPLIVGGDLNLTGHMQGYADLSDVLVDAHRDCGRWVAQTWPANGVILGIPTMVKLDYVFLRGSVRCASIEEADGAGSDHRPIVAEVVLTGSP